MKERGKDLIGIVLHCSMSEFGDSELIKDWHLKRGFDDIGYNFVICNGFLNPRSKYNKDFDGLIQIGRDRNYIGAHCKGYNESHYGICLIGNKKFTFNQIMASFKLIKQLTTSNEIDYFIEGKILTDNQVAGHYEFNRKKTCPNINMDDYRYLLNLYLMKDRWGGFCV